jgi:CheY-like chemotaxis protein
MTTQSEPTHRHTVLVVEDNDLVAEALHAVLVRRGLHPIVSHGVREALDRIKSEPVDLLITDVMMPQWGKFQPRLGEGFSGCGGLELISEFRRRRPTTKIIAITAGGDRMVERAKLAGAHRVLEKPFAHGTLLHAIAELAPRIAAGAAATTRAVG